SLFVQKETVDTDDVTCSLPSFSLGIDLELSHTKDAVNDDKDERRSNKEQEIYVERPIRERKKSMYVLSPYTDEG
ncbi:hypothetical protein LINPERHAP1_LOCUS19656, partial [Linum perenne]